MEERERERELEIETEEQSMLLSVYGYVVTITRLGLSVYRCTKRKGLFCSSSRESRGGHRIYVRQFRGYIFQRNLPPTGIRLPLN